MTETTRVAITGIRTVGVPVTDQDRAVNFYVERLGFEKMMDAAVEELGGRWIEVAAPGTSATTTIALVPASDDVPCGVETGIRLITSDAAAMHAYLRDNGVEVGELLRWGDIPPMFAVRDPDGNGLEVVE